MIFQYICILVHFQNNRGPKFNGSLPISPHTVGYCKNQSCKRKKFPLHVAIGITDTRIGLRNCCDKRRCVDIGSSEFALGLAYEAASSLLLSQLKD